MGLRSDHCEWNPDSNCAAWATDAHHRATLATVSVGRGVGNFHVCDSCASLPRFARFKRRPLPRPAPPPPTLAEAVEVIEALLEDVMLDSDSEPKAREFLARAKGRHG